MQTYRLILVALTAGTLVSGCGGGSGGSGLPVGTPGPLDVCAEAFASARERGLLERLTATDPAPVPLSSCTFDVDRSVTIGSGGCGPRVVIDRSFTGADALGHITIAADGSLVTPLAFAPIEIATRGIAISGLLGIGTDQCPVGGEDANERVTITFTGARPADPSSTDGADKGIELRPGGTLRLIGAKGRLDGGVSWTRLAAPAGPAAYQTASAGIGVPVEAGGERVLHIARDVTVGPGAWRARRLDRRRDDELQPVPVGIRADRFGERQRQRRQHRQPRATAASLPLRRR